MFPLLQEPANILPTRFPDVEWGKRTLFKRMLVYSSEFLFGTLFEPGRFERKTSSSFSTPCLTPFLATRAYLRPLR